MLARIADGRSDVYGAGILLFEMITGQVPHAGESPLSVAYQHVNPDVPPPSSIRRSARSCAVRHAASRVRPVANVARRSATS